MQQEKNKNPQDIHYFSLGNNNIMANSKATTFFNIQTHCLMQENQQLSHYIDHCNTHKITTIFFTFLTPPASSASSPEKIT